MLAVNVDAARRVVSFLCARKTKYLRPYPVTLDCITEVDIWLQPPRMIARSAQCGQLPL